MTTPADTLLARRAAQALRLLDLTNLDAACDETVIAALADQAQTPFGAVAALCVYPRFIKTARARLGALPVKIATVTNFPDGAADEERTARETAAAFASGADEVDFVMPYRALSAGDTKICAAVANAAVKEKPKHGCVKAILETGALDDEQLIRTACRIALHAGVDFLKTSTGKMPVNATPAAARLMLEEIKAHGRPVGFKAAGGIKSARDAQTYLDLAAALMGESWITPTRFRFGASSVRADLIAAARGDAPAATATGY